MDETSQGKEVQAGSLSSALIPAPRDGSLVSVLSMNGRAETQLIQNKAADLSLFSSAVPCSAPRNSHLGPSSCCWLLYI